MTEENTLFVNLVARVSGNIAGCVAFSVAIIIGFLISGDTLKHASQPWMIVTISLFLAAGIGISVRGFVRSVQSQQDSKSLEQ